MSCEVTINNQKNSKTVNVIAKTVLYTVLVIVSLILMFPFFQMLFMSMMGKFESLGIPEIRFFPSRIVIAENYKQAFSDTFIQAFFNTVLIILINLVTVPLSSSLCAFGFSRCKFKGREIFFSVTLSTMMLPSIVVQIPLYGMFYKLKWLNTMLPFIIPSIFGGGASNIFLLRQFMRTLPKEMDEAATIDGANKLQVYWRIILPLCKPILVFTMIGVFNGYWNDFTGPLMYCRTAESWTLPLAIYKKYAGPTSISNYPSFQMATGMIMIIPPLIVFAIFQKQIIGGVVMGSVKG